MKFFAICDSGHVFLVDKEQKTVFKTDIETALRYKLSGHRIYNINFSDKNSLHNFKLYFSDNKLSKVHMSCSGKEVNFIIRSLSDGIFRLKVAGNTDDVEYLNKRIENLVILNFAEYTYCSSEKVIKLSENDNKCVASVFPSLLFNCNFDYEIFMKVQDDSNVKLLIEFNYGSLEPLSIGVLL